MLLEGQSVPESLGSYSAADFYISFSLYSCLFALPLPSLIPEALSLRVSISKVVFQIKITKLVSFLRAHSLTLLQSKMMSGIGGFVLGLLFLVVGLFTHFRNQKREEPVYS